MSTVKFINVSNKAPMILQQITFNMQKYKYCFVNIDTPVFEN